MSSEFEQSAHASDETRSTASSMTTVSSTPPSSICIDGERQIPTEVFVAVAAYLDATEIENAARVCRSWRLALYADAKLWRQIVVNVDGAHALERFAAWVQRAGHLLEKITFFHSGETPWTVEFIHSRFTAFRRILKERGHGGINVEKILFVSREETAFTLCAMHAFFHNFLNPPHRRFLPNLMDCSVETAANWPMINQNFFAWTSDLHNFSLQGSYDRDKLALTRKMSPSCQQWLAGPAYPEEQADPDRLEEREACHIVDLSLTRIILEHDIDIPLFPDLTCLCLNKVNLGVSFYKILEGAPNLKEITTDEVILNEMDLNRTHPDEFAAMSIYMASRADSDDAESGALSDDDMFYRSRSSRYSRWDQFATRTTATRIEPAIVLSKVRKLTVQGPHSTMWWQVDAAKHPNVPEVHMPGLRVVDLEETDNLDDIAQPHEVFTARRMAALDTMIDEIDWREEDEVSAVSQLGALWSLCSVSESITRLNLRGAKIGDIAFIEAVCVLENVEYLNLRGCLDVSESSIHALSEHCRRLKQLDLRETYTSARTVAATVEDSHANGGCLQSVFLEDPGPFYAEETEMIDYTAYRWLEWIGVVPDWTERGRLRSESKSKWEDGPMTVLKRRYRERQHEFIQQSLEDIRRKQSGR